MFKIFQVIDEKQGKNRGVLLTALRWRKTDIKLQRHLAVWLTMQITVCFRSKLYSLKIQRMIKIHIIVRKVNNGKMFAKSKKEESLIQKIRIFREDIGMEFGI